jgi:ABC-type histidine transport system ATPase subunit
MVTKYLRGRFAPVWRSLAILLLTLLAVLGAGAILEQGAPERILSDTTEPRRQQFLQRMIEAGRL